MQALMEFPWSFIHLHFVKWVLIMANFTTFLLSRPILLICDMVLKMGCLKSWMGIGALTSVDEASIARRASTVGAP